MAKMRSATRETIEQGTFDPLTLVERFELDYPPPEGAKTLALRERGFVPSELRLMLEVCGVEVESIPGGTAGSWERGRVDLDEFEIMLIARRGGAGAPAAASN